MDQRERAEKTREDAEGAAGLMEPQAHPIALALIYVGDQIGALAEAIRGGLAGRS